MRFALLLSLLFVGAACDSTDDSTNPTPATSNTYAVTFLGTEGGEVSRATLAFAQPAGTAATTGTYAYVSGERIAAATMIRVTVQGTAGQIRVSLDPSTVDDGVSLFGTFGSGTSTGTWGTTTVAGPVNRGTFRAVRQ